MGLIFFNVIKYTIGFTYIYKYHVSIKSEQQLHQFNKEFHGKCIKSIIFSLQVITQTQDGQQQIT